MEMHKIAIFLSYYGSKSIFKVPKGTFVSHIYVHSSHQLPFGTQQSVPVLCLVSHSQHAGQLVDGPGLPDGIF
jgi:hypothetical protein